ncbi:amino acid ABC transporter permease [Paraburkholderia sp. JPY432]|uniref:amino acid ABC transporter permease n=1 Tax=Paraburkholderia youngii TaxID=2782701 RepID=UPI0015925A06|nr:amino acid ABC transporter permease [Paraburkholderia youngii]NUX59368.1 amino acid ABC transporter permease [Paraburkholderia youngii]NVH78352.1 amino acid ABC transporter permease [Paraburkholderia youngii]
MNDLNWLWDYLPSLWEGLRLTVILTATSMIFGGVLGLPLAFMKMSKFRLAASLAGAYGTVIRGMPLLVQILLVYFGLPVLTGIRTPATIAGGIAMALYTAAFLAEVFRSGIQAVDRGQMEAGRAIGFGHWQTMRLVIIPQAFRTMIPNLANQLSITLKNTSLLSVIGVTELTLAGQNIYMQNFDMIRVLSIVGGMYLVIYLIAERMTGYLEQKVSR